MVSVVRLTVLSIRHSPAVWVAPFMVAFTLLFYYNDGLDWSMYLWPSMSNLIGQGVLFIGPGVSGVAAWATGRESRCGVEDLLSSTSRSAFYRLSAIWVGTMVWGLAAYGVLATALLALAHQNALWGGPTYWPMIAGVFAVPAFALFGCITGASIRDRMLPPFIAFTSFLAEVVVGLGFSSGPAIMPQLAYLSPTRFTNASVWYGIRPDVGLPVILFTISLNVVGLGFLAKREGTQELAVGVLACGVLLATTSIAILLASAPLSALSLKAETERSSGAPGQDSGVIPYTSVCEGAPIRVCMHPAYRMYLYGEARTVDRLVRPLAGMIGAPTRAMQTPGGHGIIGGVLEFTLTNLPADDSFKPRRLWRDASFFGPVSFSLVCANDACASGAASCPGDSTGISCRATQAAIRMWLVRQAGLPALDLPHGDRCTGDICLPSAWWKRARTIAHRFAALPERRREVWLRSHFQALRAGHMPLRELP
jgi:hypothetical protein